MDKELMIGFIGAGKVGFSLGKLLATNFQGVQVTGYYSLHEESAKEAAEFTSSNCYHELFDILCNSNVLFLTVPDREITGTYNKIKDFDISDKIIIHCSGSISSQDAFPNIDENGAKAMSIHPLFPVSSKYESYKDLPDAFYCMEGEISSVTLFKDLFETNKLKVKVIESSSKVLYHSACVFSSNLVLGLVKESIDILGRCGFTSKEALESLSPLIKNNIESLLKAGPVAALTGPIERNDINTINKHINNFSSSNEIELYKLLSLKVLELAEEKNINDNYSDLKNILKS